MFKSSGSRRFLFYALSFLLIIFLLFLITELGLRVIRYFYESPISIDLSGNFDYLIICVGDSHTEGAGAPKGLDYPHQLASLLNSRESPVRYKVVNIGRSGYNTSQAANAAIKILKDSLRKPDLVIFSAGINNCDNFSDARILPERIRKAGARTHLKYLLSKSKAFRFSQITYNRLKNLLAKPKIGNLGYDLVLDVKGESELKFLEDWTLSDIEALFKEAQSRGTKLVLLNYWNECSWMDNAYDRAIKLYGVELIDVRDFGYVPRSEHKEVISKLIASDWHPNQFGYARIAELVYSALIEKGLIPKSSGQRIND